MVALRACVYASTFIGFLLIYFPYAIGQTDRGSLALGPLRYVAIPLFVIGAIVALRCVYDFIRIGRGTPAPFDPPRALVAQGWYRWVRNPMYIGGLMLLLGHVVWWSSIGTAVYTALYCVATASFVVFYEEPTLKRKFGAPYERYMREVPRWIPRRPRDGAVQ